PTSKSQIFSTAADNQPGVEIHVLQGERPMAADNRTLGRFMLDGILPAPRGVPQIEVTFDIDANGILSVKAHDKGTGREQKITITASSGLSKEEVEKMQREGEMHAAEDTRRREEIETRNAADTLAYTAEKTLREQKDKIPSDLNQEVESKVQAVRSALQGTDTDAIRQAAQELSETMQKIGAAVYGQQPPPPGGEAPGEETPPGKEEEGTVEGEFHEV
ncbi:MAG TPA: molecular chaperone DnaK, partial [Dehalococcoidia bacterium]|nr:molecular chaperone DnaK [Dehalococcoidia bacterium]